MERRALGRDARLSRSMAWTMLALVVLYGGVAAYLTIFAVLWAWYGAPAFVLLAFVPAVAALAALGPYRTALRLVGATPVEPEEEPALHAALDRLCALADAPKPRLAISESAAPEAFAVGVRPRGSVIVVTRSLLSRLEPPEVEAVLAHELAHVVNRDGAVMTIASFPLFAGSWLVRKAREQPALLFGLVLLWPYLPTACVLYFACGALTRNLSVSRELAADRGAARLTGSPEALASALQKLTGALPLIPEDDLRRLAPLNALLVVGVDPFARAHPPVQERIAQLGEIGREEGRPERPPRRPRLALPALLFVAVFVGMLLLFMRT